MARIRLRYVKRPKIARRFVPRGSAAVGAVGDGPAGPGGPPANTGAEARPGVPMLPSPARSAADARDERANAGDGIPPPGRASATNASPEDADADVWRELNEGAERPGTLNWS